MQMSTNARLIDKVLTNIVILFFVVSMLDDFAKSQLNFSVTNEKEPFLYKYSNQNGNDIKAYLLEWKQFVRYNKEILYYASTSLKMNKIDLVAGEYPN